MNKICCTFIIVFCGMWCVSGDVKGQIGSNHQVQFGPWEYKKSDSHLWLHFVLKTGKDQDLDFFKSRIYVQLANVKTKFVPLAYFKGDVNERNEQSKTNEKIAKFIAKHLGGKKIFIDDANPGVFAGPGQVNGVVWLDHDRKQSLQELLIKNGLAVKNRRMDFKR